jgi:hypothetical protein
MRAEPASPDPTTGQPGGRVMSVPRHPAADVRHGIGAVAYGELVWNQVRRLR